MIELKTNPDTLHAFASNLDRHTFEVADIMPAIDSMNEAAQDLKNLRDYAYTLERTTNETSAEIQKWKDKAAEYQGMAEARESNYNAVCEQRDAAAAALLAIFRPELEMLVHKLVDESIEDLRGDIEDMKERVDDVPNEDDINDAVREFMQYEAKFKITLE